MLDSFILECAAQEGASADEIGFIRKYGTPQNKQQKCSIACVGELFGIVSTLLKYFADFRMNVNERPIFFKLNSINFTDEKWKNFT